VRDTRRIEQGASDEDVMRAVCGGDVRQLGALFERHHVALYEFLYRTTGDRHAAEDLVQDVFVRILKYRHTYRESSPFLTWMYRIARNARADYFRGRRYRVIELADVDEPTTGDPSASDQLEWGTQAALLRRALMCLPDEKRELIVLARYQQMPHAQIAQLLDIEVGAVKVRVHRALRQLRKLFDDFMTGRELCDVKTRSSISDPS